MRKWPSWSLMLVFVIGIAGGAIGCAKLTNQAGNNDPAALTQGLSSGTAVVNSANPATAVPPAAGDVEQANDSEQQVTADFKNDMTFMVKAWKNANDTEAFRKILSLGFAGELLDQKVTEAEEFIVAAQGVDIIPLNFGQVKVTKIEGNKALLEAEVSYSGYTYNLSTGVRGEKFDEVRLHNEYTLELTGNQWYITGERPLDPQ